MSGRSSWLQAAAPSFHGSALDRCNTPACCPQQLPTRDETLSPEHHCKEGPRRQTPIRSMPSNRESALKLKTRFDNNAVMCKFSDHFEDRCMWYFHLCASIGEKKWSWPYFPANNNTAWGFACGGGSLALLRGPRASCNLISLRKRSKLCAQKQKRFNTTEKKKKSY